MRDCTWSGGLEFASPSGEILSASSQNSKLLLRLSFMIPLLYGSKQGGCLQGWISTNLKVPASKSALGVCFQSIKMLSYNKYYDKFEFTSVNTDTQFRYLSPFLTYLKPWACEMCSVNHLRFPPSFHNRFSADRFRICSGSITGSEEVSLNEAVAGPGCPGFGPAKTILTCLNPSAQIIPIHSSFLSFWNLNTLVLFYFLFPMISNGLDYMNVNLWSEWLFTPQ